MPKSMEMQMEREAWALYDTRTGKRLAMSSYLNKEQAKWDLENMTKRDKEKPLQVSHIIPYIGIVQLTDETWNSLPGEVIDGRNV
jgi:hypothetical protein